MAKKYLFQPKNGNLLEELTAQIRAEHYSKYSRLRIMVAYAKVSGTERLIPLLSAFKNAGGTVEIIVGIGQKNTSKEAVEKLMAVSDSLSIFHNPASINRTFHPKTYLLNSEMNAWGSVGSSNLTRGGLLTNYEANEITEFDLTDEGQAKDWHALENIFGEFVTGKNKCSLVATPELVQVLNEKGVLPSEEAIRKQIKESARKDHSLGLGDIFGADILPEPKSHAKPLAKKSLPVALASATGKGFWKRLSAWDVNKKSSPGQIQIPQEFGRFFPDLSEPVIMKSGGEQSDAYFNVLFVDATGKATLVENARLILYVPAPDHLRQNQEYRFTFRHREGVFDILEKGDLLEFGVSGSPDYWFIIRLIKGGTEAENRLGKRFGSF